MIDSHVIGSHIKERIAGLNDRGTARFYSSLITDPSGEIVSLCQKGDRQ